MPSLSFPATWPHAARAAALALAAAATLVALPAAATTAACRTAVSFERWLEGFRQEARAKGITPRTLAAAGPLLVYDPRIVAIDRGQRIFQMSFLGFADRLISKQRLQMGAARMRQHAAVFSRVEQEFGVPAPVISAFWGLESDFGSNMGKEATLKALTTLAYDCRRAEMFRAHLLSALELVQRGDLAPEEMVGSWAGELGQTQFMPTEYLKHAVDYDGDGRRNLLRSVPDVLGSTGKYLAHLGWRRGEAWLQEVVVPAHLPWHEADLTIRHPRAQWVRWGVTAAHGGRLPADTLPAALILPMGRFGPAFLAYPNFDAFIGWNESLIYSLTAAYFATRLAGAPPVGRGRGEVASLDTAQMFELQRLLARHRFDVGEIDGKLGAKTRAAVRAAQLRLRLPADSYPTVELIERLRRQ